MDRRTWQIIGTVGAVVGIVAGVITILWWLGYQPLNEFGKGTSATASSPAVTSSASGVGERLVPNQDEYICPADGTEWTWEVGKPDTVYFRHPAQRKERWIKLWVFGFGRKSSTAYFSTETASSASASIEISSALQVGRTAEEVVDGFRCRWIVNEISVGDGGTKELPIPGVVTRLVLRVSVLDTTAQPSHR